MLYEVITNCRRPEMVADAAYRIVTRDSRTCTGNFFIDEKLLAEEGVTDTRRRITSYNVCYTKLLRSAGKPLLWERHLQRLFEGCTRLHIDPPAERVLLSEAERLCVHAQRAVLKLVVTRGSSA